MKFLFATLLSLWSLNSYSQAGDPIKYYPKVKFDNKYHIRPLDSVSRYIDTDSAIVLINKKAVTSKTYNPNSLKMFKSFAMIRRRERISSLGYGNKIKVIVSIQTFDN